MANMILCSRYLLGTICLVYTTLVLLANAENGVIEKPTFTYIDHLLVKITYVKGVNRTLYICCNASLAIRDPFLESVACGSEVSFCPNYNTLSLCTTRGQQVCCAVNGVQNKVKMQGYIGWSDGKTSVPLSDIATYVTNSSRKKPKSVSVVNVTRNLQQGLDIRWTALGRTESSHTSNYVYCVHCKPLGNQRAKAVFKCVEFTSYSLLVSSKEVTAVSKYRCCIHVENLGNNQLSEKTCQNITTSEQAPSASPVIICGNDTVECPSVIRGTKRDITILFKPPSPKQRNGKIIYHEIYFRNVTAGNFTTGNIKRLVVNGSLTEAVITNAETRMGYDVFMTSCTIIGCSHISNTVHIPGPSKINTVTESPIVTAVLIIAALVVVILALMVYMFKRHQRLQKEKQLPQLKPKENSAYEYPDVKGGEDEIYLELESQPSDNSVYDDDFIPDDDVLSSKATIVSNPIALTAEQV